MSLPRILQAAHLLGLLPLIGLTGAGLLQAGPLAGQAPLSFSLFACWGILAFLIQDYTRRPAPDLPVPSARHRTTDPLPRSKPAPGALPAPAEAGWQPASFILGLGAGITAMALAFLFDLVSRVEDSPLILTVKKLFDHL
jgi:hypothetical protein